MAGNFRNKIASALKGFSNNAYGSQFYNDLAWGGLTKDHNGEYFPFFKEEVPSASDRRRIENVINAEQYGKDTDGNYRNQKGDDAGC